MVNTGRRERNRVARHSQLVAAAGAIVTEKGLDGLTMQEVAERVDCAVGTIYTYFSSKSALLAALQANAIGVLSRSYDAAASQWDDALDGDIDYRIASLTRMINMGRLFVSWQHLQPREFDFLQMLSMSPDRLLTSKDIAAVVPLVLTLFAEARVIHDAAVGTGAIQQDLDRPGDEGIARTVRWIASLDGAILVGNATVGVTGGLDPEAFDRDAMTDTITCDYLLAWGATKEQLAAAVETSDRMAADGSLLPGAIT
jgi:AcrR family transcriptional regulator